MESLSIRFSNKSTTFCFGGGQADLLRLVSDRKVIFLADENFHSLNKSYLRGQQVLIVPSGEASKSFQMVNEIVEKLLEFELDRGAMLVACGGGVVCDLTGFIAGIYKRGIDVAYVPTTVLAMVDAAVGGKNGIDFGGYKNMIGLIRQPDFIFYDISLLDTLPDDEWSNGFAEIIKMACIADSAMFDLLKENDLSFFRKQSEFLKALIRRNVLLKTDFVQRDEFEKNIRRKLNFGHTLGHAIEMDKNLKHGFAVALGMVFAAKISEQLYGFPDTSLLIETLGNYGLPTKSEYNVEAAFHLMKADKKRTDNQIQFVLLKAIAESVITPLDFEQVARYMKFC